jgi:hypothetical protein
MFNCRRLSVALIPISFGAVALFAVVGCRRKEPPRIELSAVERCERGITNAVSARTQTEGFHMYYAACKDIYAERGCSAAFEAASKAEADRASLITMEGCRKAYCPILDSASLEMCAKTFKMTPENILRDWPPLHEAIIEHDAKDLTPRIQRAQLRFYARTMQPWPKAGEAPAADAAAPSANPSAQSTPSAQSAPSAKPR